MNVESKWVKYTLIVPCPFNDWNMKGGKAKIKKEKKAVLAELLFRPP